MANYAEAERVLAASPREDFQDIDFSFYYPKAWFEAMIARDKTMMSVRQSLHFVRRARFWRSDWSLNRSTRGRSRSSLKSTRGWARKNWLCKRHSTLWI